MDLTDDFEIIDGEDQLDIDVDWIGNFSQGILDQEDMTFFQELFQLDFWVVLYEESYFGLIVGTLEVDLGGYQVWTLILILVSLISVQLQ